MRLIHACIYCGHHRVMCKVQAPAYSIESLFRHLQSLVHSLVHVVPLLERQCIICSHCCLAGQLAVTTDMSIIHGIFWKAALLYVDCAGWDEDCHLICCLLLASSIWEWTNWGLPKSGSRGVLEWWGYGGDSGTGSGKAPLPWPVCICFMQEVIPSGTVILKWNLPKESKEGHLCK